MGNLGSLAITLVCIVGIIAGVMNFVVALSPDKGENGRYLLLGSAGIMVACFIVLQFTN